jgi:hypothetical protein
MLLENFKGSVKVIVGVAFNHTHPDVFQWLTDDVGADLRVFRDDGDVFHPKIYLFRDKERYALFIGSSNLTYSGFYTNYETNCLIEGTKDAKDIVALESTIAIWRSPTLSFKPSTKWIDGYRNRYKNILQKQRKHGMRTMQRSEEEISPASWLQHSTWEVYYKKVLAGVKESGRDCQRYHDVLDAAARELPVPWKTEYFKDIEKRRILGGIDQYGWLGHVAASGQFRKLLANGTPKQWKTIVDSINSINRLKPPILWPKLQAHLRMLTSLGPSMRVWGRLLCITHPDLFCTISAPSVRKKLSHTLDVPQHQFDKAEGYVQLIRLIHSSPWFNSPRPNNNEQVAIWRRRAAFLDGIFYNEK